jgi:predicted nucleic acid-binding protein
LITAIDSSVLLDVLVEGAPDAERSYEALAAARERGRMIVCPVVWSEVRALFKRANDMAAITDAGIEFDPFDRETSELAGKMWRAYRSGGGRRVRLIADFLIAAHAQIRADCLLTRDRGFARRYFGKLRVAAP